jgi:spore germination protein KB
VQYAQDYLGTVIGQAVGALLIWYFLVVSAQVAREVADAFAVATMPKTPTVILVATLTLVSATAARHGIEVTARLGEAIFFFALMSTALIALLPYDAMRFDRLLPLFPGQWRDLIPPVAESLSFHSQFILAALMIPHLDKPDKAGKYVAGPVAVIGLASVTVVVSLTVVLGPNALDSTLPTLRLTQMIALGEFIERTESIVMALWTWVAAVKLAAFIWAASVATRQVFGLESHKSLAYPFAALATVFSTVFFEERMTFREYLQEVWAPISTAIIVFIIGAVGLSYVVRRLLVPALMRTRGSRPRR